MRNSFWHSYYRIHQQAELLLTSPKANLIMLDEVWKKPIDVNKDDGANNFAGLYYENNSNK